MKLLLSAVILGVVWSAPLYNVCNKPIQDVTKLDYTNQTSWGGNCSSKIQSPINLTIYDMAVSDNNIALEVTGPNNMIFDFTTTFLSTQIDNVKLHTFSNGGDNSYSIKNMDWHFPAEHAINNQRFDGELQIFFTLDTNASCGRAKNIVALSIPLQSSTGIPNNTLQWAIKTHLQNNTQYFTLISDFRTQFLSQIQSNEVSFITYEGSFTSPPCDEQVQWYVLSRPMRIKDDLLALMKDQAKANYNRVATVQLNNFTSARSLQDDNERMISKGVFWWKDDYVLYYFPPNTDDTVNWAAVWVASLAPFVFLILFALIYGLWTISNTERRNMLDMLSINTNFKSEEQQKIVAEKND